MVALEQALNNDGYPVRALPHNVWDTPFRAAAVTRLLRDLRARRTVASVCVVGFGAGHSSLLALLEAPDAAVFAYDTGIDRHVLYAHDLLDARFPERLNLMTGDATVLLPMHSAYSPVPCDVLYVDGPRDADSVAAVLAAVRPFLRAGDHVVVLAGGGAGTEVRDVWRREAEAGRASWESTVVEAARVPDSDALLVGMLVGDGVGAAYAAGA